MRANLLAFAFTLTLVLAGIAPALAAPGQPAPSVAIQYQVVLLTTATLLVTVTASCAPWSGGTAYVVVTVEQPIAGTSFAEEGRGAGFVTCDANAHDLVIDTSGGPFTLGPANAYAEITTVVTTTDARKVLIVAP